MTFDDKKHAYFIGIGGIGMSALARYFISRGLKVSGYDKTESTLTKKLVEEGMKIGFIDDPKLIPKDIDIVVYTPAIPEDHLQWNYLKHSGITFVKRAEALGWISRKAPTIAVAGTHGKTTTSSILTHLLIEGGIDCTAFIGGIMKNYQSNFINGNDDWVVLEADEFDRSFLHLNPQIAVITSMDADHLDIYGHHQELLQSFKDFSLQICTGGTLWVHHGCWHFIDEKWRDELEGRNISINCYGINDLTSRISKIWVENGSFYFNMNENTFLSNLPGRHNIDNSIVGIEIASCLGLDIGTIQKAMQSFEGILRRFEKVASKAGRVLIDDYAHHPSELEVAIDAAHELYPDKRILGVFQPHLYSRTHDFYQSFGASLGELDDCILLPIYPARELPIPGVTSEMILPFIPHENKICVNKENLIIEIKNRKWDVLMILGAGNIDRFIPKIKESLFE